MGQDAGLAERPVVGVVVLDRVEDDRQARKLAPDRNGRRDAVQVGLKLHVHQDDVGRRGQAEVEGLLAAAAGADDAHRAGGI